LAGRVDKGGLAPYKERTCAKKETEKRKRGIGTERRGEEGLKNQKEKEGKAPIFIFLYIFDG
jgi:hypothetical protein